MWPFGIRKKRRAERERQQNEEKRRRILLLVEKAEKRELTDDEINELFSFAKADFLVDSQWLRLHNARGIASAMSYYGEDRERLERAIHCLGEVQNLDQRVFALAQLIECYDEAKELNRPWLEQEFGHSSEKLLAELQQAVRERHDELLSVWTEGPAQLEELEQFILLSRMCKDVYNRKRPERLKALGVDQLPYPKNWDDVVARLYATPRLDQFIHRLLNRNEALLLAEQTRRPTDADEAFTNAQLVLAYCRHDPGYRLHVGDILVTELAEIVNTYRSEEAGARSAAGTENGEDE